MDEENIYRPDDSYFLEQSILLAFQGMRLNVGGPFGAIIVQQGVITGRGCNQVVAGNDPTAHAEIVAIRQACRKVGAFHLQEAVLYSSCEPCPMCLAAAYWAGVERIVYGMGKEEAARMGFGDREIYREMIVHPAERMIPGIQMRHPLLVSLQAEWEGKKDKVMY